MEHGHEKTPRAGARRGQRGRSGGPIALAEYEDAGTHDLSVTHPGRPRQFRSAAGGRTGFATALDDDPAADAGDYGVCTIGRTAGQATRITAATGGSHTTGVDATTIVATLATLIAAAVTSTGNVSLPGHDREAVRTGAAQRRADRREPRTVPVKLVAKIELQPGEATMDDCCSLEEAVRLDHGAASLGVLDLVSDRTLVVTGVHISAGLSDPSAGSTCAHTRTVEPRRS